jgi:hypothetical protein
VERVAIDHEKYLGAEMGMLYLLKNMYSYGVGITEQDWKQQLIINSRKPGTDIMLRE